MAKSRDSIIDVSGLSIQDIMNIDIDLFNTLGERDLRKITSRLVSASNKRIRNLERKGIESPAMRSLGSDAVFSTKLSQNVDKTQRVNKLRSEFARARNFLRMKTSTITGYRKYERQVKENLESDIGRQLTPDEITTAFRILHKLQNSGDVAGRGTRGSMQARNEIFKVIGKNFDALDRATLNQKGFEYDDWIMESTKDEYEDYFKDNPESQFESFK